MIKTLSRIFGTQNYANLELPHALSNLIMSAISATENLPFDVSIDMDKIIYAKNGKVESVSFAGTLLYNAGVISGSWRGSFSPETVAKIGLIQHACSLDIRLCLFLMGERNFIDAQDFDNYVAISGIKPLTGKVSRNEAIKTMHAVALYLESKGL